MSFCLLPGYCLRAVKYAKYRWARKEEAPRDWVTLVLDSRKVKEMKAMHRK